MCQIVYLLSINWWYLITLFWRVLAHFEKWILTLKSYYSKTTQPNLKSYTSKFKLDYPLSNKSIFRVVQKFIRSQESNKRPIFLLDHPVWLSSEANSIILVFNRKRWTWTHKVECQHLNNKHKEDNNNKLWTPQPPCNINNNSNSNNKGWSVTSDSP